jgi:starvation-inducible DNA-binding protein
MNLEHALKVASATIINFYIKVHGVHFNYESNNFYEIHKLTDKIWKYTIENFDGLNEQIRSLDIYCPASFQRFQELSLIKDQVGILPAEEMLRELLMDSDQVIEALNEVNKLALNHLGLQNFVQDSIQSYEKFSWFLRATIK